MTEIERKALALLNELSDYEVPDLDEAQYSTAIQALCRAIEQHDAFKRDVSDAIQGCMLGPVAEERLSPFILQKPVDPLVEAVNEAWGWRGPHPDVTENLRAALAKRGLEVREIEK